MLSFSTSCFLRESSPKRESEEALDGVEEPLLGDPHANGSQESLARIIGEETGE
jgi:hypothetical protein